MKEGFVSLVGAGPGDPGLLTLHGRRAVAEADVVLYDHLVHRDVLANARRGAELVYTGKQGGAVYMKQEEITDLVVRHAKAGRRVARLKGGDPFLFGRGGEEALACAAAGIGFEVIPGVSSAWACPAYAGIPLTHRGLASCVTVVTGHESADKAESAMDWDALARTGGTLCFLMGMKNLGEIAKKLEACGLPGGTPAAVVEWGTYPRQRTAVSTLSGIADECARLGLGAPAVAVIGRVAGLRESLAWFEKKPLFGIRVLVTRPEEQAEGLAAVLASLGADPIRIPATRITDPGSASRLREALARLPEFDYAVFTSVNGVERFFACLGEMGFDARSLAGVRVAAIGPATAAALAGKGVSPDLCPEKYTSSALLAAIGSSADLKGKSVLLPRSAAAPPDLAEGLAKAGAIVEDVEAYGTVPAEISGEDLALIEDGVDASAFMSSSSAAALLGAGAGGKLRAAIAASAVFSIGPATSKTLRSFGLAPVEAAEHTSEGVVSAIVGHFRR